MKKLLLLLPLLSYSLPVHAVGPWRHLKGSDGVVTYIRLIDREGGNAFVQTKAVVFGEYVEEADMSYTINCKNEIMLDKYGSEMVKIRGIWRFAENNKPYPTTAHKIFNWACR